jgi:hypothetical protein
MIKGEASAKRELKKVSLTADLIVTGGGLSGSCCAITAARAGLKVVLVQDRPVLGGNASSEIRLWVLGATSHMGNNNRWAREGGVVDEILVENMYRNPEGNAVIFDTVVLDKVTSEPNITLLLNTAVHEVIKSDADTIQAVNAFCSQNGTSYNLKAPLFCDASGDGVVGFLAGAAFRMGAESQEEFGEKFAPPKEYGELPIYFYTKDAGKPVNYVAPSYALQDITKIPRYRNFNAKEHGCQLWWIEYGGRLDTVHETETIKWELWKVVYGVWNYIKNSGKFPEAKNLTLEWVGTIPGKRESRRFEGDYILTQQDVIGQRHHEDAVAFGGWSVDLHPADGVFSERSGCNQWHSKGLYQIPYRCYYSRNIRNLFLAGRIISVSHVAFGSSRVMGTAAYGGQVAGMAAALCIQQNKLPQQLLSEGSVPQLQQALLKRGHYIPGFSFSDAEDLVQSSAIRASSELRLQELPEQGLLKKLDPAVAQLLPLHEGKVPQFVVHAQTTVNTKLEVELCTSERAGNFTPDIVLDTKTIDLVPGRNCVQLGFNATITGSRYVFVLFRKNPDVELHFTKKRITGILSVFNQINAAVSNYGKQIPEGDIGVDAFEFWCPQRRPNGHNIAIKMNPALSCFGAENVRNGIDRPTTQPNAWVADFADANPRLEFSWPEQKMIKEVTVKFDADFDHPMESVLMGHPENVMPFCVRDYKLYDDHGKVVFEKNGNYQTINRIKFEAPLATRKLVLEVKHPSGDVPASVFEVQCYG